jgi:hypothetical protein
MEHVKWLEQQYGYKPNWICVNEGKEYLNGKLKSALMAEDIEIYQTTPYSQLQNRVSERMNCTLARLARAMLKEQNLPNSLWEFAITHTTYI